MEDDRLGIKDVALDFTSLLDVILIILFFFIIFSHLESGSTIDDAKKQSSEMIEEAQNQANEILQSAETQAGKMLQDAEKKLKDISDADENAGKCVEAMLAFQEGRVIQIRFSVDETNMDKWTLDVFCQEELIGSINSSQNYLEQFCSVLENAKYKKEDYVLCEFVYDSNQYTLQSSRQIEALLFEDITRIYEHFMVSRIDTSEGAENEEQ